VALATGMLVTRFIAASVLVTALVPTSPITVKKPIEKTFRGLINK
jgi:hypothetical protein